MASQTFQLVHAAVVAEADRDHAQYPQYAGHWSGDEWVLVRFVRKVETKLGLAFAEGDLTIAKISDPKLGPGSVSATAYSRRNRIDTSVSHHDFEVVWEEVAAEKPFCGCDAPHFCRCDSTRYQTARGK